MLKSLTILLACLLVMKVNSQTVDWAVSAGGVKSDKGTTIVVDAEGYIYETGYYNEQAQFGSFNTGFSYLFSKEVYVAKMDLNGNYMWVTNGLNYFDDRGLGLCVDPQGNVYVTGTCWGGLQWGSLTEYNSSTFTDQIFVVKLTPDGNEVWMKNAGVDGTSYPYNDDHGQDLACDSQGNIIITGFLSNNDQVAHLANFDAIQVNIAAQDSLAFVAKLSNAGTWQWVETFEGIYAHRDNAVAVDDEDNIYVTGSFTENSNFGIQTLTSYGKQDIYVVKYDTDGNFQWVAQAGSEKSDRGNDIVYGNDGHMYIAGEFRDICVFGFQAMLDNNGGPKGRDIFVAKITKDGKWVWASKAGSKKGSDKGIGLTANTEGNIFVTGQFSGNAKFETLNVDSDGDSVDVFIAAIDTLGAWRWVIKGGGSGYDRGSSIAVDTACNVYATGFYTSDLAFEEVGASNVLGKEIFTVKISEACFGYDPPVDPEPEDTVVTIVEPCFIISSNVITANADGTNDEMYFFNYCDNPVEIVIVNRWGRIVYKSNDPTAPWNGTNINGNLVPEGVYFWRVHMKNSDDSESYRHGHLTLLY